MLIILSTAILTVARLASTWDLSATYYRDGRLNIFDLYCCVEIIFIGIDNRDLRNTNIANPTCDVAIEN